MGLLDTIVNEATSALSKSGSSDSGNTGMMDAISGLLSSEQGGLQGLISTFKEKGLGDAMASWISTGRNLPISSEQIQSVLGNEKVQAIAEKVGLSSTDVSEKLATMLPEVIDKLTPEGTVPEGGLLEKGLALLKSFGGKSA